MRLNDVRQARAVPGRSALLYLTDRCPVGCAHCSVKSQSDSPSIEDYGLFRRLVAGLCERTQVRVVGISGGEPFVERRGLVHAVQEFSAANKEVVLYTSGLWGSPNTPAWITDILAAVSVVFLSTDEFHRASLSEEKFIWAAKAVAKAKTPLVVPVIKQKEEIRAASTLLQRAFGSGWREMAELEYNPPLAYGRGSDEFGKPEKVQASSLGVCRLMTSNVVRYDGRVTACCNEEVIVGKGPAALSRYAETSKDVLNALDEFEKDPLLRLLGSVGVNPLIDYHRFQDLCNRSSFSSICELCWLMHERMPKVHSQERVLVTLATMSAGA